MRRDDTTSRCTSPVYGSKVMFPVRKGVQENVKQTIQNMTGITVSRVDVLVVGLTDAAEKE